MGKTPVTRPAPEPKRAKRTSSRLISECHARLNDSPAGSTGEALEGLGGFAAYQAASLYGTKHSGDTSRWLLKQLRAEPRRPAKLRVLDVGALAHNYADVRWMQVEAIDLRPTVPGIRRQDFLAYSPAGSKDLVCLSLVINFVGEPELRGRMLAKAHQVLAPDGLLFVVLPRSCIERSRYVTPAYFGQLCRKVGFETAQAHTSAKLAYFLLRRAEPQPGLALAEPCLRASGHNNFKIRL